MSCSTDSRVGSILMEFVIVLPIYILLFGALFLIGDMGLNAIRISTGDRNAAMDAGDRSGYSLTSFLWRQMDEEALNTYSSSGTLRADEKFQGAWSWQSAGRTTFAYKLPSYGPGLVSYPYLRYGSAVSGGSVLGTLVGGGTVLFHSKDYSLADKTRKYNYYTLKRTDLGRLNENAYRNWDSQGDTSTSLLTDATDGRQYWYKYVYDEPYADSNADKLDSGGQGADEVPDLPSGREEYKRYSQFVTWSQ